MATRTKRPTNKGIGKGLWVDEAVLARHLQSGVPPSSHPADKNTEASNHILQLADMVLDEENHFDQE